MTSTDTVTDADALARILERRVSCRGFLPDEVPDATLERIFTMAQRTASWCNSQAWQVELLSGEAAAGLAEFLREWVASKPMASDFPAPERYEGVYRERRRAAGHGLYNAVGIAREDTAARAEQMLENFRFFGAPHVAVVTSAADLGPYGAVDCGGYVTNVLNAAASLGVATCPQAALALYSDALREYLDLPADRLSVCGISLGYADPDHPANTFRAEREDVARVVNHRR